MRGVRSIHHRYVNFSEGDLGDRVALLFLSAHLLLAPPPAPQTQRLEAEGVRGVRRGTSRPPLPTRNNDRVTARGVCLICRVK